MSLKRIGRGRSVPLEFSSFILLGVDEMLKMDDRSMSGILKAAGLESLFKGVEQVRRDPSQKVPSSLLSTLDGFEAPQVKPFLRKLRQAIEGDVDVRRELSGVGAWQVWRFTHAEAAEEEQLLIDHFVEVEVASRDVDICLANSRWQDAAEFVQKSPLLRRYVGESARNTLAEAGTPEQALPARVAGLLEVLLAQVARLDVWMHIHRAHHQRFRFLLHRAGRGSHGPGPALVSWLKEQTDARTLAQLVPVDQDGDLVSESTLKRWSSGATFPSEHGFREVVERRLSFVDNGRRDSLFASAKLLFFIARRLDKTLRLADAFFEAPLPDCPTSTSGERRLLDAEGALGWACKRYDSWLDHWALQGAQPFRS